MTAADFPVAVQWMRRATERVKPGRGLSVFVYAACILSTIVLSLDVTLALGGAGAVEPNWFYVPIMLAAYRFGHRATFLTAIAATIAAGPLTPDHVAHGSTVAQMTSEWATRGVAFVLLGQVMAALFSRLRRQRDASRQELLKRARLEASLARQEARFAAMVRHSSDLTTTVSANGVINYVSPSCQKVLKASETELVGSSFAALLHPEDRDTWRSAVIRATQLPFAETSVECRLRRSDGVYVHMESQIGNLLGDPSVASIVLNTRDVSERHHLEEQLRFLAFHDTLTGLANRALFMDRLAQALLRLERTEGCVAVLFVDLDEFKSVNDRRGHPVGDDVLKSVGNRLREVVRVVDTVARLGGDEFGVLVECNEPRYASHVADRIHDALELPIAVGDAEEFVHASIGIVATSDAYSAASELLRDADVAMYSAKNAGKGRSRSFHKQLHDQLIRQLELESDLTWAVERRELVVHYQPIIDLTTGSVKGVEALVRWNHPQRGMISPNEFIPLAEANGKIVQIGAWLLGQACSDVKSLQEHSERSELELSVNLSARQLQDTRIVYDVSAALANSGFMPGRLTLEITESGLMTDADRALAILEQLKSVGVKLSIDDFGTGYSSLAYLQRLPVDELKIDRAFITAMDSNTPESTNLIHTIVQLAQSFGLSTVAEGIETREQLERVRIAHCSAAQGFLFARPVDAQTLQRTLVHFDANLLMQERWPLTSG